MPKAPWQTCEICRHLPASSHAEAMQGESLPAAADKLEHCLSILRCPLCHSFYYYDDGNDPHHFMPDPERLERIEADVARRYLANYTSGTAKRWLRDLDAGA